MASMHPWWCCSILEDVSDCVSELSDNRLLDELSSELSDDDRLCCAW